MPQAPGHSVCSVLIARGLAARPQDDPTGCGSLSSQVRELGQWAGCQARLGMQWGWTDGDRQRERKKGGGETNSDRRETDTEAVSRDRHQDGQTDADRCTEKKKDRASTHSRCPQPGGVGK